MPNKKITANVPDNIKVVVEKISTELSILDKNLPNKNWIALRLLENDQSIIRNLENGNLSSHINAEKLQNIYKIIEQNPLPQNYQDELAEIIYTKSAKIIHSSVSFNGNYRAFRIERAIDNIVTHKVWGFGIMLFLLASILWLSIIGANYPSEILYHLLLDVIYPELKIGASVLNFPWWLSGILIDGIYLSSAWVVAVMLPPMAIFFPLFTLLEDFGYLPRVAFNLDRIFKKNRSSWQTSLNYEYGIWL